MIAEAWDAAGLYQVGSFVGDSWREWNGRFRDDVRSFFRGEDGFVRHFADRLLGSSEIYRHEGREAEQSVNFITCHDGFTLNDLVSYNQNIMKPMTRATVTARTITVAGTAALRARPMILRSRNSEIDRLRTS